MKLYNNRINKNNQDNIFVKNKKNKNKINLLKKRLLLLIKLIKNIKKTLLMNLRNWCN
jgi:hypothetical protein